MDAHLVILGHDSSQVPHLSVVEVVASQSSTIGHQPAVIVIVFCTLFSRSIQNHE
jgi:hypothetical protein